MRWLIASAVASAVACSAAAGPAGSSAHPASLVGKTSGYVYFNRPGADFAAHNEALQACEAITVHSAFGFQGMGPFRTDTLTGRLATDVVDMVQTSRGIQANVENCMVARGWRVVRLSETAGEALAGLPKEQRQARLAEMVGAQAPPGEVARIWANDAVTGALKNTLGPGAVGHGSLSLANMVHTPAATPAGPAGPPPPKTARGPKDARTVRLNGKAALPPGWGMIVFRVTHPAIFGADGVWLMREGHSSSSRAWIEDGQPDRMGGDASLQAAYVPPGRWRIAAASGASAIVEFCLGSPSFEVRAGEVVYAGEFAIGAAQTGPVLDLAGARALLSGAPALLASLRLADYRNGAVVDCPMAAEDNGLGAPTYLYAYEIEGAPFEDGYAAGSKASSMSSSIGAAP